MFILNSLSSCMSTPVSPFFFSVPFRLTSPRTMNDSALFLFSLWYTRTQTYDDDYNVNVQRVDISKINKDSQSYKRTRNQENGRLASNEPLIYLVSHKCQLYQHSFRALTIQKLRTQNNYSSQGNKHRK